MPVKVPQKTAGVLPLDIVQAVVRAVDEVALVVNRAGEVVLLEHFLQALAQNAPSMTISRCLGEHIGCVTSLHGGECGLGPECLGCELRDVVERCVEHHTAMPWSEVHFTGVEGDEPVRKTWLLCAEPLPTREAGTVFRLRDITTRSREDAAVRERERLNWQTLDAIQAGVLLVDARDRRIVYANPFALRVFGRAEGDVKGHVCHEFVCPGCEKSCPILDLGQAINRSERVALHADGTRIPIRKRVVAVESGGGRFLLETFTDLREQRQAEREIRKERDRARSYLELTSALMVALDAKGRVSMINQRACEVVGWSSEDLVGRDWFENCVPEPLRGEVRAVFNQIMAGEKGFAGTYENPVLTAKGTERWIFWTNSVLQDDRGRVVGTLSAGMDVTDERRTQEALMLDEERLEALLQLHGAVQASDTDLAAFALEEAVRLTRSSGGCFLFLDDDEQDVTQAIWSRSIPEERSGDVLPAHTGVWLESLRERGHIIQNEPPPVSLPHTLFPRRRHISIPILDGGRIVAIAGVGDKELTYDDADLRQLNLFMSGMWGILKQRRSEARLRASEEKFRALAEQSQAAIVILRGDAVIFANEACASVVGMTVAELEGLKLPEAFRVFHAEDVDLLVRGLREMRRGRTRAFPPHDFRILLPEGGVRWISLSASAFDLDDDPSVAILAVDVTDRKLAEERRIETLRKLRAAFNGTVEVISRAVETRDPYTAGHQRRVADLARAIAREMGLDAEVVDAIRMAGILHDIGKIAVPAEILSKPTRLSPTEFALIQEHPRVGYDLVRLVDFPWPLHEIIYQHHEYLDGTGYPRHLGEADIRVEARVLTVADIVEAMASHRPYRPSLGLAAALDYIHQIRGKKLDPDVVDACVQVFAAGYTLKS